MDLHLIERAVGETTPIVVTFKLDNVVVDLTGATVLFFAMWAGNYEGGFHAPTQEAVTLTPLAPYIKIDGEACTHGDTTGVVTFSPTATMMDTPGRYNIQYKITFGSGVVEIVGKPLGSIQMELTPSLASL